MIGELSLSGGSQVSRAVTKEVKESDRGRQRKGKKGWVRAEEPESLLSGGFKKDERMCP